MDCLIRVEAMLEAISSVRSRAHEAYSKGNIAEYRKLMEDLMYLECMLPGEADALVKDIRKAS